MELEKSGEPQISTTHPDARALLVQGQAVEVSYNVQTAVDQKNCFVIGPRTINRNDRNALSDIAIESKENIQSTGFTALVDKGCHNGREIQSTQEQGITSIMVATPELVNSIEKGTTKEYPEDKFIYDSETDTYICPQGSMLRFSGTWHTKTRERDSLPNEKISYARL
jgi:hypothetical protein